MADGYGRACARPIGATMITMTTTTNRERKQPQIRRRPRARLRPGLALVAVVALTVAACGGTGDSDDPVAPQRGVARTLALLPDESGLRRHALVADLSRLRTAYPQADAFQRALLAVELPDALAGAAGPLWPAQFGLSISDVSSFAAAGFHPGEIAVAAGTFPRQRIAARLRQSGYTEQGGILSHGADGSIDPSTDAGRLSLSALDRVIVTPSRLVAGSTTALARAAAAPATTLAENGGFAAAAAAIDPVTSAAFFDAGLLRPPSGVPVTVIAEFPARLVAIGVDDQGADRRVIKIVLVYEDGDQAAADAEAIEDRLPGSRLIGAQTGRFSDVSSEWSVAAEGPAVTISGRLPPGADPAVWRTLVERGDLAIIVRPAGS